MKPKNYNILPNDLPIPKNDGLCDHLTGMEIPDVSLLTSNGDYIKLRRKESFKIVFYIYPMTINQKFFLIALIVNLMKIILSKIEHSL